jgi:hypothetical protein
MPVTELTIPRMTRCFGLLASLLLCFPTVCPAEEKDGALALAYFRQRYGGRVEIDAQGREHQIPLADPMEVEQLHLAISMDGRNWKPLNENRPIWQQHLRDPFIRKGPDGLWHLMGTGGRSFRKPGQPNEGPVCLHAVSKDLLNWETVEALPLMKGVKDGEGRPARNIWAPEWFTDETSGDLIVLWSFEDQGLEDLHHRRSPVRPTLLRDRRHAGEKGR